MHVVHIASTAHTGLTPLASITPGAISAPRPPQSSSGKVGETNHFRKQGGWIGEGGPSKEAGFRKHCLGTALGARVGQGTHAQRSPWRGKGCRTCSFRKEHGAQALGELLGGVMRWGAGASWCCLGRGLKYGEGNSGMQNECAQALGKHTIARAQTPLTPAKPLALHVHGRWCSWSLGRVPDGELPLAPPRHMGSQGLPS